jgi:cysteine desulfurase
MSRYHAECYGNPSSLHHFGAQVAAQMELARGQVAQALSARETEIVFTSGGTEANNLALRGALAARPDRRHVVTTAVEHVAILEPVAALEREGVEVTRVGVDRSGRLDVDGLAAAIRDDTLMVSVMLANNETGVVFPVQQVAEVARSRGAIVHSDAINAVGKMPVSARDLGVNLLSVSAHKFHGPKGAGALYIRRGTPLRPTMLGGSQERQRRGGTENVAGIIGLGAACALLAEEPQEAAARMRVLRDQLEAGLKRAAPNVEIIGAAAERLPNTTCACFAGCSAEAILLLLSQAGVCASSGSACSSGSLEPSHVLQAMGVAADVAQGQVRLSLSRFTTEADVEWVLAVLPSILEKVAAASL